MSDDAAAEFASAGVATETATKIPRADAALRISDWHEAKALETMMGTYLFVATRTISDAVPKIDWNS